ncbi:capsule assembly Wzi family protein [Gemmatimonadota bacterium]
MPVMILGLLVGLGPSAGDSPLAGQALIPLAGHREDGIRAGALRAPGESVTWSLFRRASTLTPQPEDPGLGIGFLPILPQLQLVWNSDLPFSRNDGALWAARGASVLVRAGFRVDKGPLSLILAPEFTYSQNRAYQLFASEVEDRSPYSSPWHEGLHSLDLPSRFGNEPWIWSDFGQSSLTFRFWGTAVGAATENVWWGPGLRNSLIFSNQAPGFPHLFLRTEDGVETPAGRFRAHWMVGNLVESLYFDEDEANDLRSLSAFALSFEPAVAPGLSLGVMRSVVAPVEAGGETFGHALDALLRWDRRQMPDSDIPVPDSDPLLSAYFRWAFPAGGVEVWGEWARLDAPASLEDLLTTPHRTQAYLVGFQWVRPLGWGSTDFRIQSELTSLEQARASSHHPLPLDFYSGQAAPQGYTHRGQALGAGIGPGSSSQWIALDLLDPSWRGGIFLERIRWNNDALYRLPSANLSRHDVSIRLGFRYGLSLPWLELFGEIAGEERYNYLFQNGYSNPGGFRTIDVRNYTLSLFVIPGGNR